MSNTALITVTDTDLTAMASVEGWGEGVRK